MPPHAQKKVLKTIVLILVFTVHFSCSGRSPVTPLEAEEPVPSFKCRALIALSDGDQDAFAYATGNLNKKSDISDKTSLITSNNGKLSVCSNIKVSNSVISWPQVADISPDGNHLFVIETRGEVSTGTQKLKNVFEDLPEGRTMTIVNIANPYAPDVVSKTTICTNPEAIDVSPDGKWIAVSSSTPGLQLTIYETHGGKILNQFIYKPMGFENTEITISSVKWHPSGKYLSFSSGQNICFYRFETDPMTKKISLKQHGNILNAGVCLSIGEFSPDGNYYVISDLNWKNMSTGTMFNSKGSLVSIKFSEPDNHTKEVDHFIASKCETGLSPEGFTMSPDGSAFVVVNMARTYLPAFPFGFWPAQNSASLSVIEFNKETGILSSNQKEYPLNAILPESAVFDDSGSMIAVTSYQGIEEPESGFIEFWKIENTPEISLKSTGKRLSIPRGVHDLVLVR